jgi:hypothetical protein
MNSLTGIIYLRMDNLGPRGVKNFDVIAQLDTYQPTIQR